MKGIMNKKFLFNTIGFWLVLTIILAIICVIMFIIMGNWFAAAWAVFAISGDGLALKAEYRLWILKEKGLENLK
jgi:hypothetical protein